VLTSYALAEALAPAMGFGEVLDVLVDLNETTLQGVLAQSFRQAPLQLPFKDP